MPTRHMIEVNIRDRPGALGGIARILATHGINIEGFSVEHNQVRFLAHRIDTALELLVAAGFQAERIPVVEIILDNRPGALAHLANALADAGVEIVNTFGIGHGATGLVYVRVDDVPRAAAALKQVLGARIAA